ncbi:hypothetical protein Fot_20297 [Forsythia ovata]|uniref:Uncharacterized protein n=1 Tax=Forsythia ovata TaxID=205694 RepID=A0ABD1VNI8_9LAMI
MADDFCHPRRPPESSRPRHPIRQHSQEEMGRQLGLHGSLRIRRHRPLLAYRPVEGHLQRHEQHLRVIQRAQAAATTAFVFHLTEETPRTPFVPEECHSDCDSSSSVVDVAECDIA